jgi:hypothetical protein
MPRKQNPDIDRYLAVIYHLPVTSSALHCFIIVTLGQVLQVDIRLKQPIPICQSLPFLSSN